MNRGTVAGRVDASARPASRGLPTMPQPSASPALRAALGFRPATLAFPLRFRAMPVPAAPRTGSRTRPATRVPGRDGNHVHRAVHSRPHKCGPSCRRCRRCLRHRAERCYPFQCPHVPPAQSPRRLHPAGFSGGDFPSVNAPRSGSPLRRSRFAVTPDRSPLQVSSRRAPVLHSRAFSATWNASLLPERVDALGTQGHRLELVGIPVRRMLWGQRNFKYIAYPYALGTLANHAVPANGWIHFGSMRYRSACAYERNWLFWSSLPGRGKRTSP